MVDGLAGCSGWLATLGGWLRCLPFRSCLLAASLPSCLAASLSAWVACCLAAILLSWLSGFLPACLPVGLPNCLTGRLLAFLHNWLAGWLDRQAGSTAVSAVF